MIAHALGRALMREGQFAEAEAEFRRALDIKVAQLGPHHERVRVVIACRSTAIVSVDVFDEVHSSAAFWHGVLASNSCVQ